MTPDLCLGWVRPDAPTPPPGVIGQAGGEAVALHALARPESNRARLAFMVACHRQFDPFLPATPDPGRDNRRPVLDWLEGKAQLSVHVGLTIAASGGAPPGGTAYLRARAQIRGEATAARAALQALCCAPLVCAYGPVRHVAETLRLDLLVPRIGFSEMADTVARNLESGPLAALPAKVCVTGPWPALCFTLGAEGVR